MMLYRDGKLMLVVRLELSPCLKTSSVRHHCNELEPLITLYVEVVFVQNEAEFDIPQVFSWNNSKASPLFF
jgi:hypothetical protein